MAEVTIVPRVKTENQKIRSPISACGDNWWKDVRIRCPYKGTDIAFRTLPSLGEPAQVEMIDPGFLDEMRVDNERITIFVAEHFAELSDKQRTNIKTLLDRATAYIADAEQIWKLWASGFTTPGSGQIPSWPLNGQPKGSINGNIEEGHKKDVDKWKRLVRAALRNLRCAEEVAKKATIRLRNKLRYAQGRRFGTNGLGGIVPEENGNGGVEIFTKTDFTPVSPGETMPQVESEATMPEVSSELQEGEINLEESIVDEGEEFLEEEEIDEFPEPEPPDIPSPPVDEVEGKPTSAKKKDNALLIAGAAALGVLALSKR